MKIFVIGHTGLRKLSVEHATPSGATNGATSACTRRSIQASRIAQPSKKRFTVRRILGGAGLSISEFVLNLMTSNPYTS